MKLETVSRNVAGVLAPPRVESREAESLTETQVAEVLAALKHHVLYPIVVVALGTGMRRGELCALRWRHVDLDRATVNVECSLEQTKAGLRVKPPKSRHGRRRISLPTSAVETLTAERLRQGEMRLALGIGRSSSDDLVFAKSDGSPRSPDQLSQQWHRVVVAFGLPAVSFHALRHTHASVLIAAGLDIATISRRLGHGSPAITLTIYAHAFAATDSAAATAIDAAIGKG